MTKWKDRILGLIKKRGTPKENPQDPEELRKLFLIRYRALKELLTSNSKALDLMTEMEMALDGEKPFGMSFVRSRAAGVSVNVWRMLRYLNELGPEKYQELFERYQIINSRIISIIDSERSGLDGPLTIPLFSVNNAKIDLVGLKMFNLGMIGNEPGLETPEGFVITSRAYDLFMDHKDLRGEIYRRVQAKGDQRSEDILTLCSNLQQLIIDQPLPSELEEAIVKAYEDLATRLGYRPNLSVRSSALGEDIAGASFAGQFHSELNVSPENIIHAYKTVVASKYGASATSYRFNRGIPDEQITMCVGVMEMIDSAAGGVVYTTDPYDSGSNILTIFSTFGLPKGVVTGSVGLDTFIVKKTGALNIVEKTVGEKLEKFVCEKGEGTRKSTVEAESVMAPSIGDNTVIKLAKMALEIESFFCAAQDVEWLITQEGKIKILQSRPLAPTPKSLRPGKEGEAEIHSADLLMTAAITASRGVGSGEVFIAANTADILSFPIGAALVVSTAAPRWAPLLSRASALVAETGSMAGHLANVAREFGVPALFGAVGATTILEQGQIVTVDADNKRIHKGRLAQLLNRQTSGRNLMLGSPVWETLKNVSQYICPLNLIDADSPDFRQSKCITMHDITRFVHEKGVQEMFNFGEHYGYPARGAKRLKCHVPMQWWVMDLDDGFLEEVDGDLVNIEQIASKPMLALWKGIMAIPWAGPPRIEAGGFMSVLVRSTHNPDLEPAIASAYSARNYFMISKNFLFFFSRLGYHLSTVEALVGARSPENYVGFSFKGGAADDRRRARRARLIADTLAENGFRTRLKGDRLTARVDHLDEESMIQKLAILGYLITHARQCDMAMGSDRAIENYRTKFREDIKKLLNL